MSEDIQAVHPPDFQGEIPDNDSCLLDIKASRSAGFFNWQDKYWMVQFQSGNRPDSSVAERLLGKKEVEGPIPSLGSNNIGRHDVASFESSASLASLHLNDFSLQLSHG